MELPVLEKAEKDTIRLRKKSHITISSGFILCITMYYRTF